MLTTLSRRHASAKRRASSRSVFAATTRFQLRLPRIYHPDRCAGRRQRLDKRPRRPTRFHRHRLPCASTPRATNRAIPAGVRGKRPSQTRSPVGVSAHAWKTDLCKSTPIYCRSMGCPPLTARSMRVRTARIISGAASERRPFHSEPAFQHERTATNRAQATLRASGADPRPRQ